MAAASCLLCATVILIHATMTETLGLRAALENLCVGTDERCPYRLHPAVDVEDFSEDGQQRLSLR